MDEVEVYAKLPISFHGRIIDHFGLEMYQKPVAAIAELVSNAWDADAETVHIEIPESITGPSTPKIIIKDDGHGMTFDDCKTRFLNIGYNTRGNNPTKQSREKSRPILGRKGIGKFAGFGVARVVRVETISKETGEKTVFEMDVEELRGNGSDYIEKGLELDVIEYFPPDATRMGQHGTTLTLSSLLLSKGVNKDQFARSMARRFLLHQRAADFKVFVNDNELPEGEDLENIEYVFPRDYREDEEPEGITYRSEDGEQRAWGREKLENGEVIEWRFVFYKTPISEDELRGVAIFTNQKLAQAPFLFNLTGGLGGQQGVEYLHGRIEATYLDQQEEDVIAPERQRVNWEHPATTPLEEWGQGRVKKLLNLWKARRSEGKIQVLYEKVGQLGKRLTKLHGHERRTVEQALRKVASVSQISNTQFIEIGNAILLSWEQGKLKDLVNALAETQEMDERQLLSILLESQVVTALHTLEAVEAKVNTIEGLAKRIHNRETENAIRDYIAENPWLISPQWELFLKEKSVPNFIVQARQDANIESLEGFKKRVDLVLSGYGTLLVVEFMIPGKPLDWDHLSRFQLYVRTAKSHILTSTGGQYNSIIGYLIADKLDKSSVVGEMITEIADSKMFAMTWDDLLEKARRQWHHYFDVLVERAPDDERVKAIQERKNSGDADFPTDGQGR